MAPRRAKPEPSVWSHIKSGLRTTLRWTRALVLTAAVLGGGAWGVATVLDPATLPLRTVRVEGEMRQLNRGRLEAAVARAVNGGFFTVDVAGVRRAAEALAWVDSAAVRRVWPHTLMVRVVEQVPVARWGGERLLNANAVIFRPALEEIPAGLPGLSGPDGTQRLVLERYGWLRKRLATRGLSAAWLRLDERRAWNVTLQGGTGLALGNEDFEIRVARFLSMQPRLAGLDRGLKAVDLRYTNGLAVRWDPPAEGEAA